MIALLALLGSKLCAATGSHLEKGTIVTNASLPGGHSSARPQPSKRVYRRRRIVVGSAIVLVLALIAAICFVVYEFNDVSNGIHRSALSGVPQNTAATNILVMGLDSRLDENGNALPADVYQALAAGDADDGGYNSNVLMLIHIPAGGGQAVAMSIPRDDWVSLPGSPDGNSMGKIKQAYGFEMDQTLTHLVNTQPGLSHADAYQQARAAARQEEVTTVSQFLGGVQIDHFIEVTLAAFYQLAVAVQPIQVCLNEATSDRYSGANFQAGYQDLSASQAVAFVRQRRDTSTSSFNLTDLDRDRRQQAFIVSLAVKLKSENFFTNFGLMQTLVDTAKQDIALDSGFNLFSFASDAKHFSSGGITFNTLPISGFGTEDGQDVNLVDLSQVQSEAAQLIAASDASSHPTPTPTATASASSASAGSSGTAASSASSPSATPSNVYTSPTVPMSSGTIPCVN